MNFKMARPDRRMPSQRTSTGASFPMRSPTSAQKSAVRREGTAPELTLREALQARDLRGYRLNLSSLPGCPDVAFTRWKVAVFVDGMFWHGHPSKFRPGRSGEYWDRKIARNQERDRRVTKRLHDLGWVVVRFWESEVEHDPSSCVDRILLALGHQGRPRAPTRTPRCGV